MKWLSSFIQLLVNSMLMAGAFLLTLFVFTNSYELAFSRTLPGVNALKAVHLTGILPFGQEASEISNLQNNAYIGGFGLPTMLKITTQNLRIPVVAGLSTPDGWLARSNAAHYIILSPSKNNNLGTTVLYARESWRTIASPNQLTRGDNIFLDTNRDWRYMYRITDLSTLDYTDAYTIADSATSKLVMVVDDEDHQIRYVIAANLVSVENIQR